MYSFYHSQELFYHNIVISLKIIYNKLTMKGHIMNSDIKFEQDEMVFNYRVAIVIKNNDKILIQKDNRTNHYTLPGGRCKLGESSINTAIREFKEETGLDISFKKEIGIIENFFTSSFNHKKYHEILIIHELEFNNKDLYKEEVIYNIEDNKKEHLTYIWLNIKDLKNSNFKPEKLLDIIEKNNFEHYINRE